MKNLLGRTFSVVAAMMLLAARSSLAQEGKSEAFTVEGVKIHYLVEGHGAPVVLIHALHSSAEVNWVRTGIVSELAKSHRVVAIDLPGHGKSDKPEKDEAYGLQLVEDVVALVDHLKIQKAHIVGYSLGGMVALKLAALHPNRVESVALGGMGWLREGSRLQDLWERMPGRDGGRTPAEFMRNVGTLALSEDEIKKLSMPVEVIVGDRDPVKRMYVIPLQHVRNDWPVVEVRDARHLNCLLRKEFRDEVVRWLKVNTTEPQSHGK